MNSPLAERAALHTFSNRRQTALRGLSRCTLWITVGLLMSGFAYQIGWACFAPIDRIVGNITCDDSFLYLEFAANTVRSGFPTFDGINITNGVQPIWGACLVGISQVVHDPDTLLRVVLAICAVLNFATGLVLLRSAARLRSELAAIALAGCWSCYMLTLAPSMIGMENSLHALVAAIIAGAVIRFYQRGARETNGALVWLGMLLAINAGVRLDSAVVSLVLGVIVARRAIAQGRTRPATLALLFGPMALGAVGFVALNQLWFGTPLPVSGMMKSFYAEHFLDGRSAWLIPLVPIFKCLNIFFDVPEWMFSEFLPEQLEIVPVIFASLLVIVPFILLLRRSDLVDQSGTGKPLNDLCKSLAFAVVIHLLVLACTILQFSDDQWYHSWLVIAWIYWIAWGLERWIQSPVLSPVLVRRIVAAFAIVLCASQVLAIPRQLANVERKELNVERLNLSRWLSANLPPAARVGSWNSGIVAYFTDRPVVNLDGLMNSKAYADWIETGGDIRNKLTEMGINVIVDYNGGDSTTPAGKTWDRAKSFRGIWTWDELSVLRHRRTDLGMDLYVVSLEPPHARERRSIR